MKILQALQELSQYHDKWTRIMTPGGASTVIEEAWAEESMAADNGYEDPNEYTVKPDGIHYVTTDGRDGGVAYAIKA